MKDTRTDGSWRLGGRRGTVLLVVAILALGLGITGVLAFQGGPSSTQAQQRPSVTVTSPSPSASPSPTASPTTASPSPEPTPDPNALADGVYPTYVRAVDIQGATVTVDVLQTFFGEDAHRAAIEDGVAWKDVQFDPVYIRNENPLLRTLPVADDVHIKLMGTCEAPSRLIGLTELRKATTPFTDTYYYELTMAAGSVVGIVQKIAISAC
jgi:hypothetical protein